MTEQDNGNKNNQNETGQENADGANAGPIRTHYSIALDEARMDKVRAYAEERGWIRFTPDYSRFGFKSKVLGVTLIGYTSGKLVVSGKGTESFVRGFIEPNVTKVAGLDADDGDLHPEWFEPHAGLDEAGKGDLFGPIVAATVIADGEAVRLWRKNGVRDSKKISHSNIVKLDRLIHETARVVVKTKWCDMGKYNMLMAKPNANLNRLLAWLHARALEAALAERTVPWGLLDQFSTRPLVQERLRQDRVVFDLRMRTHAEEDPVVAAASICARAEFVRQITSLSEMVGEPLNKGASSCVKAQAQKFVDTRGAEFLGRVAKLHFRTAREVLGLPVDEKKP
jgi:ribonuclease HIII